MIAIGDKKYVKKYYLQFWYLDIYKPFYQATVYFDAIIYSLKHFFVTNSDQLHFFSPEFMNHYKLHNHKLMTFFFFAGRYW